MNCFEKTHFNPQSPFDHARLIGSLHTLTEKYPFCELSYLGTSVLDRPLPMITLGEGKRKVLYVGTHHGMEWITSVLLTKFLYDICETLDRDGYVGHLHCKSIFRTHTLYVLPMLNPDGTEYQIHGVSSDNPLRERLLDMNGGNARGVDLNHNYDAGFEAYQENEPLLAYSNGAPTKYCGPSPESEPEVHALCNFIRYHSDLRGVMSLHTQGREIIFPEAQTKTGKCVQIAKRLQRITSYNLSCPEGSAAYGGLTDWCSSQMSIPAFTFECGIGRNPLPLASHVPLYHELREALFTFPILL